MTSSSFAGSSLGGSPHPYIPATEADRVRMLERVGVADLDALFADLPADLRDPAIDLPPALTEPELIALLTERARRKRGSVTTELPRRGSVSALDSGHRISPGQPL